MHRVPQSTTKQVLSNSAQLYHRRPHLASPRRPPGGAERTTHSVCALCILHPFHLTAHPIMMKKNQRFWIAQSERTTWRAFGNTGRDSMPETLHLIPGMRPYMPLRTLILHRELILTDLLLQPYLYLPTRRTGPPSRISAARPTTAQLSLSFFGLLMPFKHTTLRRVPL